MLPEFFTQPKVFIADMFAVLLIVFIAFRYKQYQMLWICPIYIALSVIWQYYH